VFKFLRRAPSRRSPHRPWRTIAIACLAAVCLLAPAHAQDGNAPLRVDPPGELSVNPERWTSPEGLSSTLQVMLLLTVISLAPAALMMTTCFVRVIVVLGLLRQAIGAQQLPPSQVLTALSLFITLAVMTPVWKKTYDEGILPYTQKELSLEDAWDAGVKPIRLFMIHQIDHTGNSDDVYLFTDHMGLERPEDYQDVPLAALLPAFMISELKTAFLIGFQIYLPFLVLDMVVSSVLVSMGMMMLPPVLVSLPFKLLMFVLADGWHLTAGMLLDSFSDPYG
jgi:flagellar biosynthetic protein FliP